MDPGSNEDDSDVTNQLPDHWLAGVAHYVMGFQNHSHDYSRPILKPIVAKLYPLFIVQYGILSIVGVVTNVLIIYHVMRHKFYRDATHAFMVNLAFCHFVQCAFVLPISLTVLLIQNWIFGQFLCYFLPMLQDIPLHVCMITHLLIAWDRLRWLSDPLKTRLPAFVCSCATWLAGMVIALPYPIYITYLDLGDYLKLFEGVGFCAVNLVDDMQEYMRGLFVIMYCVPTTVLSYLYIRTSRELRPPDGPLAVMMFEARAEARNKQRVTSTGIAGGHVLSSVDPAIVTRSYDLYDAELDVSREKKTQRRLCSMAAVQVVCICPLMVLRLARMVLVETYENADHFDLTFLMFVWIAFLPTAINPWIYATWVLSRPTKERLRGYLRLSSRRNGSGGSAGRNNNESAMKGMRQATSNSSTSRIIESQSRESQKRPSQSSTSTNRDSIRSGVRKQSSLVSTDSQRREKRTTPISHQRPRPNLNRDASYKSTSNPINNSCSNITSSTYCNTDDTDRNSDFTDLPTNTRITCPEEFMSIQSSMSLLAETTSNLEHDLEIIDLLERERSMNIQEMLENEKNQMYQPRDSKKGRKLPEVNSRIINKPPIIQNYDYFKEPPESKPPIQSQRSIKRHPVDSLA